MESELFSNSDYYIDVEQGVLKNEDKLEQVAMGEVVNSVQEDLSDDGREVLDAFIEYFEENVRAYTPNNFLTNLNQEAKEMYAESEAYTKDPLSYHGLRQSDFL